MNQQSSVNIVTEYIKNKIIYKELRSGDKIPTETELCRMLNVSRSSVREALKVLEAIKIIQIRRGDGTYISKAKDITFSEALLFRIILDDMKMQELLDFREQIELIVLKLAISYAKEEDVNKLKNNLNDMKKCISEEPENYKKLHHLDIAFHDILVNSTHNFLVKEFYLLSMKIFSPIILGNYKTGQGGELTIKVHETTLLAIEKKDFFIAIHSVKLSMELWSQWMQKQDTSVFKFNGVGQ